MSMDNGSFEEIVKEFGSLSKTTLICERILVYTVLKIVITILSKLIRLSFQFNIRKVSLQSIPVCIRSLSEEILWDTRYAFISFE